MLGGGGRVVALALDTFGTDVLSSVMPSGDRVYFFGERMSRESHGWMAAVSLTALCLVVGCGDAANLGGGAPDGFFAVDVEAGRMDVARLERGRPANLSLLPEGEQEVVRAADDRVDSLRRTSLQLFVGEPGVLVEVEQVRHGFRFGSAVDLSSLSDEERSWYWETFATTFSVGVIENALKWAQLEREEGHPDFGRVLTLLDLADAHGIPLKGHTLFWGIPNPGWSVPGWLQERYPSPSLTVEEQQELRATMRRRVQDAASVVGDRIDTWDVFNEVENPLAPWFVERLGTEIVRDAFEWARAAMGDDDRLLLNELTGQMAGLPIPTNDDVLAAVEELRGQWVVPDGLGLQAHFAPIQAHFGEVVETDFRVPLDEYAATLDTIASGTALPLYISELSIASPTEPELRAAQFEGLLRLYFGHPAVEEVMFWGFWSRKHFLSGYDAGIWSHDRTLTRHGEAVLALLNDRWRTRSSVTTGGDGTATLRAFYGDYVLNWTVDEVPYHARVRVLPDGSSTAFDLSGR